MRNVASRSSQHSKMLGQPASWQTVCSPSDFTSACSSRYSGPILARVLIHSGFFSIGRLGVADLEPEHLAGPPGAGVPARARGRARRGSEGSGHRVTVRRGPRPPQSGETSRAGQGMSRRRNVSSRDGTSVTSSRTREVAAPCEQRARRTAGRTRAWPGAQPMLVVEDPDPVPQPGEDVVATGSTVPDRSTGDSASSASPTTAYTNSTREGRRPCCAAASSGRSRPGRPAPASSTPRAAIQRIGCCTARARLDAARLARRRAAPARSRRAARARPRRSRRATATALAAQTRPRRGSKSSWLLIEPLAQSAPANVAPTMIISAVTMHDHGRCPLSPCSLAEARASTRSR